MSDMSSVLQAAQIAAQVGQLGASAYSMANRPSATAGMGGLSPDLLNQIVMARMLAQGGATPAADPSQQKRASMANAQVAGLSGAAPQFLQNLGG